MGSHTHQCAGTAGPAPTHELSVPRMGAVVILIDAAIRVHHVDLACAAMAMVLYGDTAYPEPKEVAREASQYLDDEPRHGSLHPSQSLSWTRSSELGFHPRGPHAPIIRMYRPLRACSW